MALTNRKNDYQVHYQLRRILFFKYFMNNLEKLVRSSYVRKSEVSFHHKSSMYLVQLQKYFDCLTPIFSKHLWKTTFED